MRIRDLAESAWHDFTERATDPQREDSLLAAKRKQLQETERLYEQTLQQAISLRQQQSSAAEMAAKRGEQAELALRAGEETLARLALQEKLFAEASVSECGAQYAQCQDAVLALAEELRLQRADFTEASKQREAYSAQAGSSQQRRMDQRSAAQATMRELGIAGREIGCDVGEALREAGSVLQRELRDMRCKERHGRK
ncbi:PspA/IM30 family protein [Paenibacillus sp. GP183]|uniref:PspA/IM30 family protein n=1 Tax=Paenibacillus sp. GP183 TaxID=1882751 RepID=UPI0008944222|nr:PspA/IM30 family protein [Paenibacillus sp. GP183]SEC63809.1 phage shock protein A (PspA) family protein [Paenibacillus sp. GP183]